MTDMRDTSISEKIAEEKEWLERARAATNKLRRVVDFESEVIPTMNTDGLTPPSVFDVCLALYNLTYIYRQHLVCEAEIRDENLESILGHNRVTIYTVYSGYMTIDEGITASINAVWTRAIRTEQLNWRSRMMPIMAENYELKKVCGPKLRVGSYVEIAHDALIDFCEVKYYGKILGRTCLVEAFEETEGAVKFDLSVDWERINGVTIENGLFEVLS